MVAYEDGKLKSTKGSWEAGVDGALECLGHFELPALARLQDVLRAGLLGRHDLGQRRLAHSGRTNEAEDRPLEALLQGVEDGREKFLDIVVGDALPGEGEGLEMAEEIIGKEDAEVITRVREILATFAAIREDRNVRVVVLRGAGRAFCAGYDLKEEAEHGPHERGSTRRDGLGGGEG